MAATLAMSGGGGGQEDPFYPLQKASLSAGFPLEDSALFGLDCKIPEDKPGHMDYTQVERLHWCFIEWAWQPGACGPRRCMCVCLWCFCVVFFRPPHRDRAIFAPHLCGASSSWTRIRVCRRIRRMFAAPCAGQLVTSCPPHPTPPLLSPLTITPPRQQLTPAPVGQKKGPSNSCPPLRAGELADERGLCNSWWDQEPRNRQPIPRLPLLLLLLQSTGSHGCFPPPFPFMLLFHPLLQGSSNFHGTRIRQVLLGLEAPGTRRLLFCTELFTCVSSSDVLLSQAQMCKIPPPPPHPPVGCKVLHLILNFHQHIAWASACWPLAARWVFWVQPCRQRGNVASAYWWLLDKCFSGDCAIKPFVFSK